MVSGVTVELSERRHDHKTINVSFEEILELFSWTQ